MTSQLIRCYDQVESDMGEWVGKHRPVEGSPNPNSKLFPVRRAAIIIASANFTVENRFEATEEELTFVRAKNERLVAALENASELCTAAEGQQGLFKLIRNAVNAGAMFVHRAAREQAEDQIPTFEGDEAKQLFDAELERMNDIAINEDIDPKDLVRLAKIRLRQLAQEPDGDGELVEELFAQRFHDQLSFVGALLTLSAMKSQWQKQEKEKAKAAEQKLFDDEIATWVDPDIDDLETVIFPGIQAAQTNFPITDTAAVDLDEEFERYFGQGGQQDAA